MTTIQEAFTQWDKYRSEYGLADYLRCAAMSCIETGLARAAYLEEAERLGFNKSTASRCWSFVASQG